MKRISDKNVTMVVPVLMTSCHVSFDHEASLTNVRG